MIIKKKELPLKAVKFTSSSVVPSASNANCSDLESALINRILRTTLYDAMGTTASLEGGD